ncbi:MAG: ribonuclease III [Erysipelotrichaceae bacterium]|nr:ribonuclease III [Erysipelotrichaceae bacterium]
MTIYDWLLKRDITVKNKNLIEQSFIHSSYVNEHKTMTNDNERLEFVGDAVLQIWSSIHLFNVQPTLDEGKMTTYRATLVCEKALAEYGKRLGLNKYLKLGFGEEKTGGRNRDSIVANMFEAFIGALYIELNMGLSPINRIMSEVVDFDNIDELESVVTDYKTRLQEYVQSDVRKTVTYEVVTVSGPSNKPLFKINVMLDGIVLGTGEGNSKKKAEQAAAKNAFDKMVK